MRSEVYEALPLSARRLVDKIECATGIEIEVKSINDRGIAERIVEVVGEDVVGVIESPNEIIIEAPRTIEEISLEDYVHELLHLERTYVKRVPQIYPRNYSDSSDASNIDNWLEHVIIYERQIKMCPGFQEKLNGELTIAWDECPWNCSGKTLKFNLLKRYMITHKYGLSSSKKSMFKALKRISPGFSVRDEARRCLAVSGDKRAFVSKFFAVMKLPNDRFWLRQYDHPGRPFLFRPF